MMPKNISLAGCDYVQMYLYKHLFSRFLTSNACCTNKQTEAVEALIQELPKFRLKAVPDDCGECLICLEEFHIGHEVRNISKHCEGINQLLMHKFRYNTIYANVLFWSQCFP